jgi:hypothetical protein
METNPFGARVGEAFGTIAWLWVFYRFSQDGKVLLGMEHPWDHGHGDHGGDHGHGGHGSHKKLSSEERATSWEAFANKSVNPGDDDDDDDDDDDEDDEDEDDDE